MTPKLTVLTFSGGKQSSALLWMVIRGDIPRPENFIVLRADPGMENSETYEYTKLMELECELVDIKCVCAPGPNLYQDILDLETNGNTRIDNPPYWTEAASGKRGRLMQGCTKFYKIAPMDRVIREELHSRHGISRNSRRLGNDIVEKWIGFSADEVSRCSESRQKYIYFKYPLIEMGMTDEKVTDYYRKRGLPIPPRSVCNACFANGLETLAEMKRDRPKDWAQAIAIDNSIRDWSNIGVKDKVYVSASLTPLKDIQFDDEKYMEDNDEWSCDSGVCFL